MYKTKNKKPSRNNPKKQQQSPKKPPAPDYKRGPFSWLIIAIVVFTVMLLVQQFQQAETIEYDDFLKHVKEGHVDSVEVGETEIKGKFNQAGLQSRPKDSPKSF